MDFRLNATCIHAREKKDCKLVVSVKCENGLPDVNGSHLLEAVGRTPKTADLQLDAATIKTDERVYIQVNNTL